MSIDSTMIGDLKQFQARDRVFRCVTSRMDTTVAIGRHQHRWSTLTPVHLALATIGSHGDVMPFVWLAERLRAHGVRVTAVSHPDYAPLFEARGSEFRSAGPALDRVRIDGVRERLTATKHPIAMMNLVIDEVTLRDARAHYDACRAVVRDCDAAVVHHLHYAAQVAARVESIPWASVVLMPNMIESPSHPPTSAAPFSQVALVNRIVWAISRRLAAGPGRRIASTLEDLSGLAHLASFFGGVSPALNLVAASPAISDLRRLPAAFTVTGAWLPRTPATPESPREIADFLRAGTRPVVVTLGSAGHAADARTMAILLEAIEVVGARALIQSPNGSMIRRTANVMPIGFVPFESLFAHVAAVVHHGGAGTTALACRAGIPSVVIPHFGDHFYWAKALVRLGASPAVLNRRRLTVSRLARAIDRVIAEERFRRAAASVALAIQAEDGAAVAAEEIIRWVQKSTK